MREKKSNFFVKDDVSSLQYARVNEMPIQTFAFPNYCAIVVAVGKDYVFLLVPNLTFLLSKLGPLAKIKLI